MSIATHGQSQSLQCRQHINQHYTRLTCLLNAANLYVRLLSYLL